MTTGYTRNDASNNISDGNIINAADLDGEFDAIETAFGSAGHSHDGSAGEGAPVTVVGPVQDLVVSATNVNPKTTNTLDLGTNLLQYKNIYIDGSAYIDGLGESILVDTSSKIQFRDTAIYINSSADGKLDIDADGEVEITSALLDINVTDTDVSGTLTVGGASTFNADITLSGASYDVVWDASENRLEFGDNAAATFGAGADLQIYHDGSNSVIHDSGTGDLTIRGTNLKLQPAAGTEDFLTATTNAEVTLYYNNNAKLATTSTGIDVTGTITTNNLTVGGTSTFNGDSTFDGVVTVGTATPRFRFIESDTTDLNTELRVNGGRFIVRTINDALDTLTTRLDINNSTGDINFYEDTGSTVKLTWDASAEDLIFNDNVVAAFGSDSDFTVYHTGATAYLINGTGSIYIRNNTDDQDIIIQTDDGAGGVANYLVADGSTGALNLYHYGSLKLSTESTGIQVTGSVATDTLTIGGTDVTATASEINKLDGVTASTAELNKLDGLTATTTELNYVDGVTSAIQTQINTKANLSGATFTGDVIFTGASYNVMWDKSSNQMEWNDSAKATFGNGADIQIQHNGSNSYIDNLTGTLYLRNTATTSGDGVYIQVDDSSGNAHNVIRATGGNAAPYATLYYDNAARLDTTSAGIDVSGTVTTTGLVLGSTAVTATAAEINKLDGVTATTSELNILDGVTASTAELNKLDGVTATTSELNILDGVTATTSEINALDGIGTIWHNGNDLLSTVNSNSSNGYVKLPNGLYIQWGYYNNTTTGTHTISFPIAFPSYCFSCVIQLATAYNNPANPNYWSVTSLSKSSFQNLTSSLIPNIYFVAIGK